MECKKPSAECTVQGKIQRSTFCTGVDLSKRAKKKRTERLSGESAGRQADVHRQHDNPARPRFHIYSVEWEKGKVVGSNVKCKV